MAEKRGIFSFSKSESNVVDKLMTGNKLITEANNELMADIKEKGNKLNVLRQELYEKSELCDILTRKISALDNETTTQEKEAKKLEQELIGIIKEKDNEIHHLNSLLNSLSKKVQDSVSKAEINNLKQVLDSKEKQCDAYSKELDNLKHSIHIRDKESQDTKQQIITTIKEKNCEISRLNNELALLKRKLSDQSLNKKLEILKQQLYDKDNLCNNYVKEIAVLKQGLNIKDEEVGTIQRQIIDRTMNLKGKTKELAKKIDEKAEQLNELKRQLFEKNQFLANNNEKIASLSHAIALKDKDINAFKNELTLRDQTLAQSHEKINDLIRALSERDEHAESLKLQLIKQDDMSVRLSNDAVALKQLSNALKEKNEQFMLQNAELSEEIDSLRYQLNKYKIALRDTEKKQKMIVSEFNNKFKDLILETK